MDLAGNYRLQPRKMSSYDIKIDIKCGTGALLSLEIGRLSVRMEIHVEVLIGGIDQRFTSHSVEENERTAIQWLLHQWGFGSKKNTSSIIE